VISRTRKKSLSINEYNEGNVTYKGVTTGVLSAADEAEAEVPLLIIELEIDV
jgi:hypothetical protein